MPDPINLTIESLGARGDGVATEDGKPVYVPFALPGEKVSVTGSGARRNIVDILDLSPDRIDAFCPHFGACGGCQLQHLAGDAYAKWKTELLTAAFSHEGIETAPEPLVQFERSARRRAVLTARFNAGNLSLGYAERASHSLVNLDHCPILVTSLNEILPYLRDLLSPFQAVKGDIRINLLAADNGHDVAFSFSGKHPNGLVRAVTTHSSVAAFARIAINGEIVLEHRRPIFKVGTASVSPPPGAFVQASASAERAMAELVVQHLTECKRVADLFSGYGTFALRLAENSVVHAAESEGAALAALDRAWRETGGMLKAITHEKRDLFRRPMMEKELKPFQGVVFDPPRAGAETQAHQLAGSKVRKIAAVSCNPTTLARDVRILLHGGYKLQSLTPIDQFAFTPHLEAVALLSR